MLESLFNHPEAGAAVPVAIIVMAALAGLGEFLRRQGQATARRSIANGDGEAATVAIKMALDKNTAQLKAVADLIQSQVRHAEDSGKDMDEFVALMRRNMELFATANAGIAQLANLQQQTNSHLVSLLTKS